MNKKIFVFVPIFLVILLVVVSVTPTIAMSEKISDKVFRLHILANSNTDEDQQLKLMVRDRLLQETEKLYNNCNSVEDAICVSKNNISTLENIAQSFVNDCGYDYNVSAYVDNEFFDTRHYENFTLPAGNYECLKVVIGEGRGHNWWCVMYPSVCISGCTDDLESELSNDEMDLVKNNRYIVKFKVVEIYEKIKNKVK